MGFVRQGYM